MSVDDLWSSVLQAVATVVPGAPDPCDLTGAFAGDAVHLFIAPPQAPERTPLTLPEALFAAGDATVVLAEPRGPRTAAAGTTPRTDRRYRRIGNMPGLPEPGAILDKYRIEEVVGVGGFAVVYRATHLMLQMPVAIKLLQPRMIERHPTLPQLLCKEARFAAQINHPSVVRVYDATHTDRITYIVMELIDGVTLADVIDQRSTVAPAEVLRIGQAVSAGLGAGMAQGLIHRDIKPSNILLGHDTEVKIVDFGMAQPRVERYGDAAPVALVGTPGYMAPDQLRGGPLDHRADIYSLGVTLYEAACGQLPFPNDDARRCLTMHRTIATPPPDLFNPRLPRPLVTLIMDMLAKEPDGRPANYDILVDRFREATRAITHA